MNFSSLHIAIVGAGVVGLANALAYSKRGAKVTVFERNSFAVGASIRNFGMIWPIGQPTGPMLQRALLNRQIWNDFALEAGIQTDQCGSLHLAYQKDELEVLEEFIAASHHSEYRCSLLSKEQTIEKSHAVNPSGLLGSLWSETEMTVDPREAIRKLPLYLKEKYGVEFNFNTTVTEINHPLLVIGGKKRYSFDLIFVCSGADFETLYPEVYTQSGITKVKLQMMRTIPQPGQWRLGPCLCAGLTLTHYGAFADCKSLNALKQRIQDETPHFPEWGIHVLVSQTPNGELTLGDSHEYGLNPEPFDKELINQYIMDYLKTFSNFPSYEIAERWNGVYPKIPGKTELIASPQEGVTVMNALSGAGMTLSFGLAEEFVLNNY